jgi:hypothetical protein
MPRAPRLLWRELPHGPMAADMAGFLAAAAELGFTERGRVAVVSQVVGRVLMQTGRGLGQRTEPISTSCQAPAGNARTPTGYDFATTGGRCTPPAGCCPTSACSRLHR